MDRINKICRILRVVNEMNGNAALIFLRHAERNRRIFKPMRSTKSVPFNPVNLVNPVR